ncbi:uncharacterized protein LOC100120223 isoform X1 [Nasonia vitripennis]|uniref:Spondin domain-containing protein n=1 Tax=Nasonia vitripennis TaxID=7425 RepID=A0A7M7TAI7_NASVI|nr:uncharacterized protein LOC100120223 isoform X1 [Nasonia vitripennis]
MPGETRLRHLLLLGILLCFSELTGSARAQCGPAAAEQSRLERQNKLAMYKVTLKTYWSRARFPRHYPEWRPQAQFGKLVGRTHDPSYVLYRLGQRLSAGARQYVETGRTDALDTGADFPNTLHAFTGPAVPQGEGSSTARAFLDGNHTLVSVFARINPSPDWFVGVDSFQLCVEGNWVDTVTVELDPLDGGTDNGFTFTAVNWPTQPQGIAYRITSRYPAHPAGSFYYPNLPRLPPIATLTFTKLREYTLTETYHEDDVEMEFVSSENLLSNGVAGYSGPTPRGIDPNRDLSEAIAEERREMETQRYSRYWTPNNGREEQQQQQLTGQASKAAIIDSIASSYGNIERGRVAATPPTTTTTTTTTTISAPEPKQSWPYYQAARTSAQAQKAHIYEDIQRKIVNVTVGNGKAISAWRNATSNSIDHQRRYRDKHQRKRPKTRPPRDCEVGEWGAWSACSRSCGVGETQRTRRVVIKPRRSGKACPPLKETKWCGSISPCPESSTKLDTSASYHW